ncbi:MAG: hypothetical protein J5772_06310 [Clostridia bacterium]|nr:hypothetical protein [Clostridia bacterium]
MKRRIISLLIALAMTAVLFPGTGVFAIGSRDAHPTPEGYNDHDYQKLVAFLEQTDPTGVKNGVKLSAGYDPADPATWGGEPSFEDYVGFSWTEGNDKRIVSFGCEAGVLSVMYGQLDLSGCTELTNLWCGCNNISSVNVSGCDKLSLLSCSEDPLNDSLYLSGCGSLSELYCSYCSLTELPLSELPSLAVLIFEGNSITELDLTVCPLLEEVVLYYMELEYLNVSGLANLRMLDVSGCGLDTLEIRDCPSLEALGCEGNGLTSLEITSCPALHAINCGYNSLTELDVTGLPELNSLAFYGNRIQSVDLSCNPLLRTLSCSYNLLQELDVSANPLLGSLSCFGNRIKLFDLSNNPLLPFDIISAQGNGFVEFGREEEFCGSFGAAAVTSEGSTFAGWFDENGELISTSTVLWEEDTDCARITAKFVQADVPGDADGSGEVTSADALTVLRFALGLTDIPPTLIMLCDMDSDGEVTSADALAILRLAMGL